MKFLSAPWRWDFISRLINKKGCVFCEALEKEDSESLICYRGKNSFVILNKYPYNTGHILIVPNQHVDDPAKVSTGISLEMWKLMNRSIEILKKNFKPQGFNIGMNLGKAGGAGISDHFHLHIVPRWQGDANFMAVVGGTKVLSYDLSQVLSTLRKDFNE